MNSYFCKLLLVAFMLTPVATLAKPCGNGHIANWKTCHKGSGSGSYSSRSGGYSTSSSRTTTASSRVATGTYGSQDVSNKPLHNAVTIRVSELRTCAYDFCSVVKTLPKNYEFDWAVSDNGFVNIANTVYWIKTSDFKNN